MTDSPPKKAMERVNTQEVATSKEKRSCEFVSLRVEWLCRKAIKQQPNADIKRALNDQFIDLLEILSKEDFDAYDLKYPDDRNEVI